MKKENAYEFRKNLLEIHQPDLRVKDRKTRGNEFEIPDNARIKIAKDANIVIETAAYDFADYLKVSMNISSEVITRGVADVTVALAEESGVDLGEFKAYKGFWIKTDKSGISIFAHDDRGAAQALYYLEDMMSFVGAPVIAHGEVRKKAMFHPQMVHSGYQSGVYPDEYLAKVAHEGRDTIFAIVGDEQEYASRVNDLIARTEKYGIDVYAYSNLKSEVSPEAPEAEVYYDGTYGRLFKDCPGLKGVILVGESVEFPSKDPNVSSGRGNQTMIEGIPTGKVTSGWYPCYDYPLWLDIVKKAARKYNPEADIVFWTYNWFWRPESVDLIKILPTDISLMVTFEMYHPRVYGEDRGKSRCDDYTIAFEGPCENFVREAKAAKERGIRLYSMTNTGGRTWDFGTIPYEPFPQQWIRRYEAMQKAHAEWGLCGIMESHDYGFHPSIISKLSKHSFMEPRESMNDILGRIISAEYGGENRDIIEKGLGCFSAAIRYYTPTNADQYGAFRLGPSYPFNLFMQSQFPDYPRSFVSTTYCHSTGGFQSPLCLRIRSEIESLEDMLGFMEIGLQLLGSVSKPNDKLKKLINLGQFITNCVKTGLNHKKWYKLCCRVRSAESAEELGAVLDEMETLLLEERKNAEDTIPIVEADSSLGWEASMEQQIKKDMGDCQESYYLTDRKHLEWKMRQVDFVIDTEIRELREALKFHLS